MLTEELVRYLDDDSRPLLVVLTGAGISAESGIPTFRDANGLWEGHNVQDVATPEAFARNPELVLRFYNLRRAAAAACQPNLGHTALAELENDLRVVVITQNVDDLHERGGSSHVVHLHGRLSYACSSANRSITQDIGTREIQLGDLAPDGTQLRPDIVWFGEEVPMMETAAIVASQADYVAVIGTSMVVYPAAGLVHYAPPKAPVYVVNPKMPPHGLHGREVMEYPLPATQGVPKMVEDLRRRLASR